MEYGYEFTDSDKNYSDIITPDYYSSSPISTLTNNFSGDDGTSSISSDIDNTSNDSSDNNLHLVTFIASTNLSSDDLISQSPTTVYPWTTTTTGIIMSPTSDRNLTAEVECIFLDYNYEPVTAIISVGLFIFGILFCLFGYRCFKAILFLTGFLFGLVIVFLICQVEDLLPQYGNVGISCLSGFLYGLICLLVPYVGFFTVGFHAGLLAGLASMIFFPWEYSVWISVLFLLGSGLFGAVANVCFPSLTILTTSMIGGAGIAVSFDYFVEKLRMANWVWSHIKGKEHMEFCWFSWLLLGLWPVLILIGVIIQSLLTARGFTIHIFPYKNKSRNPPRRRLTREERALARQAKYRYLYQVRTAGGDILSQAYIESLQNKSQVDTMSTHMSTLQTTQEEESMNATT